MKLNEISHKCTHVRDSINTIIQADGNEEIYVEKNTTSACESLNDFITMKKCGKNIKKTNSKEWCLFVLQSTEARLVPSVI